MQEEGLARALGSSGVHWGRQYTRWYGDLRARHLQRHVEHVAEAQALLDREVDRDQLRGGRDGSCLCMLMYWKVSEGFRRFPTTLQALAVAKQGQQHLGDIVQGGQNALKSTSGGGGGGA